VERRSDVLQDIAQVNSFFRNFEQTAGIHRWVQRRLKEEQPIPESMEEFIRMSATDAKGLRPPAQSATRGRGRLGMAGKVDW
jgi:hypothetical protein